MFDSVNPSDKAILSEIDNYTKAHRPIAEIKAELRAAEEAEKERIEEEAKSVIPDYTFTLVRMPTLGYHKVMDDSCILYELRGVVKNKKELRKVGKVPFEGSMTYLFNTLSGKFVMSVSGGSIFIDNPKCWDALNTVVRIAPEGGDVTHIVNGFRKLS